MPKDNEYLGSDGLKTYDALIKDYIDKKIAEAIAAYESKDVIEIDDYMPIEEYIPD